MRLLDRYILRQSGIAFLVCLTVLTLLIWMIAALRDLNLMTSHGQTILVFLTISSLALPSLVVIIAPVALFVALVTGLNRLNADSELVVMNAAGLSPTRTVVPFAVLTLVVATLTGALTIFGQPASQHELRYWLTKVSFDVMSKLVREGQFTTIPGGTITFHVRERRSNGALLGILVQDARSKDQILTYIAERGELVEQKADPNASAENKGAAGEARDTGAGPTDVGVEGKCAVPEGKGAKGKGAGALAPAKDAGATSNDARVGSTGGCAESKDASDGLYLILEKGSVLRESRATGTEASVVVFDHYAFDLSQLIDEPDVTYYKPRERYTSELLSFDATKTADPGELGRVRAELTERFVAPLYPVAFMFVALAALGQARTTRQSRSGAVTLAIAAIIAVRIVGFFATQTLSVRSVSGAAVGFAVPIGTSLFCLLVILGVIRPRMPRPIATLAAWLTSLRRRPSAVGGAPGA